MAELNVRVNWASGTLGPDGHAEWFQDRMNPSRLRFFQAIPLGGQILPRDLFVEITDVFYLQKGTNHQPRDIATQQVHVTVHNLDPKNECAYRIEMAETDN
jgi:hypothetical protein